MGEASNTRELIYPGRNYSYDYGVKLASFSTREYLGFTREFFLLL